MGGVPKRRADLTAAWRLAQVLLADADRAVEVVRGVLDAQLAWLAAPTRMELLGAVSRDVGVPAPGTGSGFWGLPADARAATWLAVAEGMAVGEVAQVLNVAPRSAAALVERGGAVVPSGKTPPRRRLRSLVADGGDAARVDQLEAAAAEVHHELSPADEAGAWDDLERFERQRRFSLRLPTLARRRPPRSGPAPAPVVEVDAAPAPQPAAEPVRRPARPAGAASRSIAEAVTAAPLLPPRRPLPPVVPPALLVTPLPVVAPLAEEARPDDTQPVPVLVPDAPPAAESQVVEPEPVEAEPVAAEPVVSEPVVSEPLLSEPLLSEPAASEAVVSVPAAAVRRRGRPRRAVVAAAVAVVLCEAAAAAAALHLRDTSSTTATLHQLGGDGAPASATVAPAGLVPIEVAPSTVVTPSTSVAPSTTPGAAPTAGVTDASSTTGATATTGGRRAPVPTTRAPARATTPATSGPTTMGTSTTAAPVFGSPSTAPPTSAPKPPVGALPTSTTAPPPSTTAPPSTTGSTTTAPPATHCTLGLCG